MIIKGERVTSRRAASPLLNHLLHGEENDRVCLVQGTEEDVRAAFGDARDADKKFALRHFIISPESETTRAEALMVLGLLAQDFAFDPATAIVFEHDKPRALAASAVAASFGTHWHALVPEIIETTTGPRVMDSRFSYLRHVKVARIAEYRLKQKFVRSNHEAACLSALESDGRLDVAAALREFIENDPGEAHREAFSRDVHQMGKRQGVDIPAARASVRAAWETTKSWTEFTDAVEADGYCVSSGDRDDTMIVETHDGLFVGAVHRLARVRKADLTRRKDSSNERTAEAEQRPRDAGAHPDRHQADPVDTIDPGRQPAGGTTAGGSRHPVADVHADHAAGASERPGSVAPAIGHRGAFNLRHLAVMLRVALHRDPVAAGYLLGRARQLARSPLERVIAHLDQHEHRLRKELGVLAEPPPAAPALLAARRRLEEAKAANEKAAAAVRQMQERRAHLMANRPHGVLAGIRGETRNWTNDLADLNTRITELEAARSAAWGRQGYCEALVADLEKAHRRQTRALLTSPHRQKQLLDRRRALSDITVARQIMAKHPTAAFGGFTMVMAAAAARNLLDRLFTPQIEIDPLLPF